MQKIKPFLWFNDQAEDAARFYTSVFKSSKVVATSKGPDGKVMVVEFELDGERFVALNGGPKFKFTEAISFVILCDTQEEIDSFWDKLTSGGGAPGQCGWLKDKYGLSWQVVPSNIAELASDPKVMDAVMKMTKLDKAAMERAHRGV